MLECHYPSHCANQCRSCSGRPHAGLGPPQLHVGEPESFLVIFVSFTFPLPFTVRILCGAGAVGGVYKDNIGVGLPLNDKGSGLPDNT